MLFVIKSNGQYAIALGPRGGKFNNGISLKYFVNTDNASGFQADLYYSKIGAGNGYTSKLIYIRQLPFKVPIIQLPLDLVYGAGVHAGFFPIGNTKGYYKKEGGEPKYYNKDVIAAGIDATIQLEYRAIAQRKKLPIIFTADFTPFYDLLNRGPEELDFGFSVRYIID